MLAALGGGKRMLLLATTCLPQQMMSFGTRYVILPQVLRRTKESEINMIELPQKNRLILLQKFFEYKFQPGQNVTSPVTALELLWSRFTFIFLYYYYLLYRV